MERINSRRIPPEDKQWIVSLYEERGMTIREIMAETGRSFGGVYHTLALAGVEMRPRGRWVPPEDKQRIVSLYGERGMTIREIMAETGRGFGAVYHTLALAGVEMRRRGRPRRTRL